MNILISGATGFVGKNFRYYVTKYNIDFNIQTFSRTDFSKEVESIVNQIDDTSCNCLIHLAGLAHNVKNNDLEKYQFSNFELTKKIYQAFLHSQAEKFIFLSSVKAAADSVVGELTESQMANPTTPYGISKRLAEDFILGQATSMNKKVFIIRPCMIHGPGNKGNLNLLYHFAKSGMPYPLGAFENQRSFLSVENLCFVIKELMERNDIPSGIYNVADDTPLSTNRVLQIISQTISQNVRLLKINKPFIKAVASMGDLFTLPFNTERLQKLTENYVVSNAKLLSALNKPLPLTSEEGLRRTIQSFAHGHQ